MRNRHIYRDFENKDLLKDRCDELKLENKDNFIEETTQTKNDNTVFISHLEKAQEVENTLNEKTKRLKIKFKKYEKRA